MRLKMKLAPSNLDRMEMKIAEVNEVALKLEEKIKELRHESDLLEMSVGFRWVEVYVCGVVIRIPMFEV